MADYQLFIDGEYVDAQAGETFTTYDPGTGEAIGEIAKAGREDSVRAIEAARKAFDEGPWPKMSGKERGEKLNQIADAIEAKSEKFAEMEARDGGGTIKKATFADVPGAAGAFRWFAKLAIEEAERGRGARHPVPALAELGALRAPRRVHGHHPVELPVHHGGVEAGPGPGRRQHLGAEARLVHLHHRAHAGRGVPGGRPPAGRGQHHRRPRRHRRRGARRRTLVDKTAFTGSTEVGRRIMQLASGTVKPVTLELGGKSANIVLDDADLDLAAACVLWGTFFHNGQVCESGTRALVHKSIYDEFLSLLVDRAGKIAIGNQMDFMTDLGPLVGRSQVETVERYVALGREEVGEPICGGHRPEGLAEGLDPAAFYTPTIFAGVDNKAKIAQEEIFGPVLCVIPFETEEEAIAIANDSIYGLAGGVQSSNLDRALNVARQMRTGTVWINDYHLIDPQRPFGGYKQSGIGRELGIQGLRAYQQVKHLHANPGGSRDNYIHLSALSGNI
jgi:acyl-CoA reductase-like NAD-dependent aldehyde dehydrogenase